MPNYPNNLVPWNDVENNVDIVEATHINDIYAEVIEMQKDLIGLRDMLDGYLRDTLELTIQVTSNSSTISFGAEVCCDYCEVEVDWGKGDGFQQYTYGEGWHDINSPTYDIGNYAIKLRMRFSGYSPESYNGNINEVYIYQQWSAKITSISELPLIPFAQRITVGGMDLITEIPENLFRNNVDIIFAEVYNTPITEIPENLFKYNTNLKRVSFKYLGEITTVPENLFKYNTEIESFGNCFDHCAKLQGIPPNLFKYNTKVTELGGVFGNCPMIEELPQDIFKYNTEVTSFTYAFAWCYGLRIIPADLFVYNTKVTHFNGVFNNCRSLQMRDTIFGDINTRFSIGDGTTFAAFFALGTGSFVGVQGVAPAIWNISNGSFIVNDTTKPFRGNSLASLSNYNSIPVAWK